MPGALSPEPSVDRARRRGYVFVCAASGLTFAVLALLNHTAQRGPYVVGAGLAVLLLAATLAPRVGTRQLDRLLGWAADLGAALTAVVLGSNAGPFSAQGLLIPSIFLVVWFGVLTLRAAAVRAGLLSGTVVLIGALRDPPEPIPVICFVFLAVLIGQMTASGRIIREELSAKAHYATLAMTDMLTGLLNRRALHEALNDHYAGAAPAGLRARRPGGLGALLLDLDHFKNVNDTYGHDIGDRVLQHVAGVLRSCAGPDDRVARWGGEEFLMLVVTAERADLERRATQIIDTLRAIHSGLPPVTVSIGIAHTGEATDVDSLLRIADRRLYRAKRGGRDRLNQDTLIHLPDPPG